MKTIDTYLVRGLAIMLCSTAIAGAQGAGLLAVANQKEHSVEMVDVAARKIVWTVSIPQHLPGQPGINLMTGGLVKHERSKHIDL